MAQPAYTFQLSDWSFSSPQAITSVASDAKGSYRMLRPAAWELTVPTSGSDAVSGIAAMDTTLQVHRNGSLVYNGICRTLKAKGDRNKASAVLGFLDPMVMWWFRRVRDVDGKLAAPEFTYPTTVGEFLFNSITYSQQYEGTPAGTASSMLLSLGSDTSTANVYAALGNFPVTIGELATLLGGSGMGEWYIAPSAGSPGIFGSLHVADRLGANVSGSVQFQYGTGAYNVEEAGYEEDASAFCNALNYWITKIDKQHWASRLTRGGANPPWPDPPRSAIENAINASRSAHQVWLADRFFEDEDVVDGGDPLNDVREMYRRIWQLEASLRVRPKRLAMAVPTPEGPKPWDNFNLGDWVGIDLPGLGIPGVEGVQRVYGWDVKPGDDGVERMGAVLTSADGGEVL